MRSVNFCFLLFLAACAVVPPQKIEPSPNAPSMLENPAFCNVDADCTCGGIDTNTGDCFVGNKLYSSKYVDLSQDCPDFCTGIAGHLETRCIKNTCQNVPREGWNQPVACTEEAKICPDGSAVGRIGPNCEFAPCPGEEGVMCTQDVKECPDGTYVARQPPNCEFAECPETSLSNAHWLCEDGSWKEAPEQCYENYCYSKGDCQLMGVKGPCGPYMVAGPTKTLHKPPIYYPDKCGAEQCSVISTLCVPPEQQPRITGFDCVDSQCIVRYEEPRY
jgi:hypothetical protein